jgi:hypothetical protein
VLVLPLFYSQGIYRNKKIVTGEMSPSDYKKKPDQSMSKRQESKYEKNISVKQKLPITYTVYICMEREKKKTQFCYIFLRPPVQYVYINTGGESNINKRGLQCVRIIYCILSDGRTDLSAYIFTLYS